MRLAKSLPKPQAPLHPGAILADAAGVLSDQLRIQLRHFAVLLKPHAAELDARFRDRLRRRHYDPKQLKAFSEITTGAAAMILAAGRPIDEFWEQVQYSGRRLAKLSVSPTEILEALHAYDRVLDPLLSERFAGERQNLKWVREQLNFCVVLTLNNAFYQVREAETQAFYELFRAEVRAKNLDELLDLFRDALAAVCHAQVGRLWLRENLQKIGSGSLKRLSVPRYIEAGSKDEPLILEPEWRGHYQSYWSIPLLADGRMGGLVQFGFAARYEWLPRELQLLDAAAERLLAAAEKARLIEDLAAREEQVRRLAEHMLQVEEEERRRIRRELHDEAGQSMLFIRLQLEMLEKALPAGLPELASKLAEARQVTERTIIEIRRIIADLSPAVLEQLGLPAAIRQLTSRFRKLYPGRVRLQIARLRRLPRDVEVIVYRLMQECYHNIVKHSRASTVNVSLRSTDRCLDLSVADDGIGFDLQDLATKRNSFGLAGMRERVTLLGGTLEIRSGAGQGTKISIRLPIRSKEPSVAA